MWSLAHIVSSLAFILQATGKNFLLQCYVWTFLGVLSFACVIFSNCFAPQTICIALVNKLLNANFWSDITKQSQLGVDKPSQDKMKFQNIIGAHDVDDWVHRLSTHAKVLIKFKCISRIALGTLKAKLTKTGRVPLWKTKQKSTYPEVFQKHHHQFVAEWKHLQTQSSAHVSYQAHCRKTHLPQAMLSQSFIKSMKASCLGWPFLLSKQNTPIYNSEVLTHFTGHNGCIWYKFNTAMQIKPSIQSRKHSTCH